MATSTFTINADLGVRSGDLIVLAFLRKSALFERGRLPAELRGAGAGAEAGSSATAFAGKLGRSKVLALAVRIDSQDRSDAEGLKIAVRRAMDRAGAENLKRVVVMLDAERGARFARAAHEGAALGGYRFDRYLAKRKKPVPVVAVLGRGARAGRKEARGDAAVFAEVNAARDLINEPANVANPPGMARALRRAGRRAGMRVEVWDKRRLKREKCGGVLAVGSASATPPHLVIGRHLPKRSRGGHLVLVGKGVTFDTGGYSLKPGTGMAAMKCDMGGAAAVFHAACAMARLELPLRVTVITPLVENAVSGTGYRPGDIIRTRSGRTVQVDNTDAEGRLILADGLDIAGDQKPTLVVDAATLTGACVVALGTEIAGVYASEKSLARKIVAAGREWGESFWEMPLHKPYAADLKTPAADIRNISGHRWAGSITAALFLQHWAPEKVPWAHLDIAGTVFGEKASRHFGPGAQGFGVKTLVELARGLC
jgi:leucyl aminopeptidase